MVNSHYLNRYNKLILFYKENPQEGFNEKHHILPKCKGGTDDKENLILIPARVHFLCHFLLYKSYPEDRQLAHAFAMMSVSNKHQFRTTSKFYEQSKIARSVALKGKKRPEWVKEKLRKPKSNKENYKQPKSDLHKKNIGLALKGKKHDYHDKVVSSEGYRLYHKRRTEKMMLDREFHRQNFQNMAISRKEYYTKYLEYSASTLKRYLKGL